jgi:hypothetical protein
LHPGLTVDQQPDLFWFWLNSLFPFFIEGWVPRHEVTVLLQNKNL